MEMVYFNGSKSVEASRELMTHHGWLYDQRRIGNGKWHGPVPSWQRRRKRAIARVYFFHPGEAASLFGNSHSY